MFLLLKNMITREIKGSFSHAQTLRWALPNADLNSEGSC